MPRRTPYTPTHADLITGLRVAKLRRTKRETLRQIVDGAGLTFDASTLSRVEHGKRRLKDTEAVKLAAYFDTTVEQIVARDPDEAKVGQTVVEFPALALTPAPATVPSESSTLTINLDNPMHPDDYRLTVWLPYLEARYNEDERKTA